MTFSRLALGLAISIAACNAPLAATFTDAQIIAALKAVAGTRDTITVAGASSGPEKPQPTTMSSAPTDFVTSGDTQLSTAVRSSEGATAEIFFVTPPPGAPEPVIAGIPEDKGGTTADNLIFSATVPKDVLDSLTKRATAGRTATGDPTVISNNATAAALAALVAQLESKYGSSQKIGVDGDKTATLIARSAAPKIDLAALTDSPPDFKDVVSARPRLEDLDTSGTTETDGAGLARLAAISLEGTPPTDATKAAVMAAAKSAKSTVPATAGAAGAAGAAGLGHTGPLIATATTTAAVSPASSDEETAGGSPASDATVSAPLSTTDAGGPASAGHMTPPLATTAAAPAVVASSAADDGVPPQETKALTLDTGTGLLTAHLASGTGAEDSTAADASHATLIGLIGQITGSLDEAEDPMASLTPAEVIAASGQILTILDGLTDTQSDVLARIHEEVSARDNPGSDIRKTESFISAATPEPTGVFNGTFSGNALTTGSPFTTTGNLQLTGDFSKPSDLVGEATITGGGSGSIGLSDFNVAGGTFSNSSSTPNNALLTGGINTVQVTGMTLNGQHTSVDAQGNWDMSLSHGTASGTFVIAK